MVAMRRFGIAMQLCALLMTVGCAPKEPTKAPPPGPETAPPQHATHGRHEGHQPIGHRFEHAEEWTSVFDDPTRDEWQMPIEVVRLMRVEPGATVADVGAGTGYFLPHLSRAVGPSGSVIAVDIEPDMVRHMRERATHEGLTNVRVAQGTPTSPSLPGGAVDCILIVNTWHHIPDRETYAAKLRDALRDGGTVVVVDYTLDSPSGPPREHRMPPEQVERELQGGGLRASRIDDPLPRQYIVVGHR